MDTPHIQIIYAKSAQSVAECLSHLLFNLDAAQLPTQTLETLSLEIHALSITIDRFKIHAASEFTSRNAPPSKRQ